MLNRQTRIKTHHLETLKYNVGLKIRTRLRRTAPKVGGGSSLDLEKKAIQANYSFGSCCAVCRPGNF